MSKIKHKTKKAAAKRFKITATGKVKAKGPGLRHNLGQKKRAIKRGNRFAWSGTQCSAALAKTIAGKGVGDHALMSAFSQTMSASGNFLRASLSISGEESTPVTARVGQRSFSLRVSVPGPHPRSIMAPGIAMLICANRSSAGRAR